MEILYPLIFKRLLDILFSALILLGLSPLLLLIMLLLKLHSLKDPIFYGHLRMGKSGKSFTCWKFRTMVANAEEQLQALLQADEQAAKEFEQTQKIKNDPRIIKGIGHFLRRSSMDELPQFFNVLQGHMSIIGPRPITSYELHHYGQGAETLLSAYPGITGLWQTSGRNDITYAQRVRLDLEYIEQLSFTLDCKIVLKTITTILKGSGY
jgi:exopolysaccharide production protein ExoY